MSETSLVTGGCGFVGRHLTTRLLEAGHSVWLLDDLSSGKYPGDWLSKEFRSVHQDSAVLAWQRGEQSVIFIEDDAVSFFAGQLRLGRAHSAIVLPHFDNVFHLASVVGGRSVIEQDPIAVSIDFAIDAVFFQWLVATKNAIGRTLYTSSSAAYPVHLQSDSQSVALKESYIDFVGNLGMPDLTYGWGKLTGEYLSRIAAQQYGIPIACVRPFSGYGGDQDQTYPIPAIARRAVRREDPLTVWGSGNQGRDFVHIDDCVTAMLLALDTINDGSAVNIGSGTLTTFKEVAALMADIAGYAPHIKPLTDQPEGVQARYSDTHYSRKVLGWQPKITLRDGFSRVVVEQQKQVQRVAASV